MLKKIIGCGFLLLFLMILSNCVFSQIDSVRLNRLYFKKYWTDTKAIVTSPAKWQQGDWLKMGILVLGTASFTLVDQSDANLFQSNQAKTESFVSTHILEHFGAEHSLILMSGIFAYGILAKKERSVSTALLALESFALASLVARIPKTLVGRERPGNGDGPYAINGPFKGTSFPSGHTTASFAVASVIATQFRDSKWIPVAAYYVATLAGISRIYDNKHWMSDVIAGAVVGTLVGNFVSHRASNSRLNIVPFRNSDYQGIKMIYIW